jgi:hypothetical protein
MAVTAAPTVVTTMTYAQYRASVPNNVLTHVGMVSTPPGSLSTPSALLGGFFDVWWDLTANKLILDTTST